MDINQIKKYELAEIKEFCNLIEDYGYCYLFPPEKLDEPFKKILEGIKEISTMIEDSYEM